MAKSCNEKFCYFPQFGGGYCKYHQYRRTDGKKPKGVRQQSDKLKAEGIKYRKLAKKFRESNPVCAVRSENCTGKTTEVHHKRGRGKYLLDIKTWLPVCHNCHKKIELNPDWAKENGFSESRLSKYM